MKNGVSIGKAKAIALHDAKFWEPMTLRERAEFQWFTEELCMPFGVFQEAVEKTLGRPVFTHEFVMNRDGIEAELFGDGMPPTFQEIMEMIPEEQRIIVISPE